MMNIFKNAKTWFQKHALCILVMLLVVLIASIVIQSGEDKDLVSHVSLAGALAGGLLAIIVLIYTLVSSAGVQGNLTEMRWLITDLRGDVGKTTGTVKQLTSDLSQKVDTILSTFEFKPQKLPSPTDVGNHKALKIQERMILNLRQQFLLMSTIALAFALNTDVNQRPPEHIKSIKALRDEAYKELKSELPGCAAIAWCDSLFGSKAEFPPLENQNNQEE